MTDSASTPLKVAVLGAGSVGSQTVRQLLERHDELAARIGCDFVVTGVLVRHLDAHRDSPIPAELLTTEAEPLIDGADIVIELIGGIEPARTYVERALRNGADVVTANKALLAESQVEIFEAGREGGAETWYEAAVAAAIPIIRPLQDSMIGDRINRVMGIVNGSTNYILDRMDVDGLGMQEALDEAIRLGYAEADPSADVEGWDAAAKATILAGLAFHTHVPREAVACEGITGITGELVQAAKASGQVVKLLAVCERLDADTPDEAVNVRVTPVLLPRTHPLAAVHGGMNAVFVDAMDAGSLMFYGAGAGGVETSSTVLADFVLAAKRIVRAAPPEFITFVDHLPIAPLDRVRSRYRIELQVGDEPGTLAAIAGKIAELGVSVRDVQQISAARSGPATLVVSTHRAPERDLQQVVAELRTLDAVESVVGVIRVEGVE